jgi:NitT/TauT family transport system substrate-binding protein
VRDVLRSFTALLVCCATAVPAFAQQEVKIGMGFGLAFLPLYVCEDLKLIEKHAKEAHLDVKASFPRFMGAAQVQDAIVSGAIDVGPFGTAPLLAAWQKAKDTPSQIFAVSGLTSLPLELLSNRPNEQSIADITPAERIAMPTLTSPQMYLLQLQAEKTFGQYDRLNSRVVALSHADAIAGLVAGAGQSASQVTAYFSSPPFTVLALRDANVHPLLRSSDVMGGKSSFLIMAATKAYIDAHPQMPDVIDKAMDEAARIIHDDPHRAAQIYLTHEPSSFLNSAATEAMIGDIKDEFGSTIYGVQTIADFMARHGELKTPPQSWKEIVAPSLLNSPST